MDFGTVRKFFKYLLATVILFAFWFTPAETQQKYQIQVAQKVVSMIPMSLRHSIREKVSFASSEVRKQVQKKVKFQGRYERVAHVDLTKNEFSPEQRISMLNHLAYTTEGKAPEIRALIESDLPVEAGNLFDPHSLASYRRNFELRLRLMALELYQGKELSVKKIKNKMLRDFAAERQSGGSVTRSINRLVGVDERSRFTLVFGDENAEVIPCPSAPEIESLKSDFEFLVPGKEQGSWRSAEISSCQYKVVNALQMMKGLSQKIATGDAIKAGPDAFDMDFLQVSPYEFLKNRVRKIQFESYESAPQCLNGGVVAYVDPVFANTIRVCPLAEVLPSALMLTYLFVHEARHVDGYPHVECASGPYAIPGYFSCDPSYETGGSYGAGAEYYVKIVRDSDIEMSVRQEARYLAVIDFLSRFNTLPFQMKKGVMLKSEQGKMYFYEGETLNPILQDKSFASSKLVLNNSLPEFFDLKLGSVGTYTFTSEFANNETELGTMFSKLPAKQRLGLVDVYHGTNYSCLLYPTELHCDYNGETSVKIPLKQIHPVGFLHTTSSRVIPAGTLFIVDRSGVLVELPRPFYQLQMVKESQLKRVKTPYYLKGLAPLQEKNEIGLRLDGSIWNYNSDQKKWQLVDSLKKMKFEKMIGPTYWSPILGSFK